MATKTATKKAPAKRPSIKDLKQCIKDQQELLHAQEDAYREQSNRLKQLENKYNEEVGNRFAKQADINLVQSARPSLLGNVTNNFAQINSDNAQLLDRLEAAVQRIGGKECMMKAAKVNPNIKSLWEALNNNVDVFEANTARLALIISVLEEIG